VRNDKSSGINIYNDFNNAYRIKEDELEKACTMYKTDVKCIQNFSQKTLREDTISET
jgi:hypothetical protein